MPVYFKNKGEIDLNTVRVIGVSVKETNSPIGYFGTGLKYALSVLLRKDCMVEIWTGHKPHPVSTDEINIRGTIFNVVTLDGEQLSFTTEYGKNWEMWQAYRELYSNTLDEEEPEIGICEDLDDVLEDGYTVMVASGQAIEDAYANRGKIVLVTNPLEVVPGMEIHGGESDSGFYRNIRAYQLRNPSMFRYNVTSSLLLTEDRTLRFPFQFEEAVSKGILQSSREDIIERVLTAPDNTYESTLKLKEHIDVTPSDAFVAVARRLHNEQRLKGAASLFTAFSKSFVRGGFSDPMSVNPTVIERKLIQEAYDLLSFGMGDIDPKTYTITYRQGQDRIVGMVGNMVTIPAELLQSDAATLAKAFLYGMAQCHGNAGKQLANLIVDDHFDMQERKKVDEDEIPY